MFEEAFRLEWNEDLAFHTLSSATHSELVNESASVIFTISSGLSDDKVFNYTLPYSAFDLQLAPPLVNETTYYFPLKRSSNGINILGRAFLQEIYVIVDYERANFSISQARSGEPEDIVTIWNTTMAENDAIQAKKSAKGSPALYVGVALAVSVMAILVIIWIIAWKRRWWFFRKTPDVALEQEQFEKAEMHGEARPRVEAMATERVELEVIERRLELIETKAVYELHIEAR